MTRLLMSLVLLTAALPCLAADHVPGKAPSTTPPPPPDAEIIRQGGDTIEDAVLLTLPVVDQTGTTTGYTDDYDHECPFYGGPAPDVVYTFFASANTYVDIDMFGSSYDTKIWVYDEALEVIACNDDYYPDYTSRIGFMLTTTGAQYFLVIDGYGSEHGEYLLNITAFDPCDLGIPAGAELENEPPLAFYYEDTYNNGCINFTPGTWQLWNGPALHAKSGFFNHDYSVHHDTDWFEIPFGPDGILVIEGDAASTSSMYEVGPQDCQSYAILQEIPMGPCSPGTMTLTGEPGSMTWFVVAATAPFYPRGYGVFEFEYTLINHSFVVAVERHSWSGVKALFH